MRANAVELAKRPRKDAAKPQFHVVEKETQGIKKLSLGSLVKPSGAKKSKSHPIIAVSGETAELLAQFLKVEPQYKELEKQSKSLKQQVAPLIKGDYFTHLLGTTAPDSTFIAPVGDQEVRLVFKESYSKLCSDDRPIIAAIGAQLASEYFYQATELKLELDKIPDEKQEPFIAAVLAAAEKFGITDGISAKQYIKPRAGFHDARTRLLTAKQNMDVDAALPMSAFPQLPR